MRALRAAALTAALVLLALAAAPSDAGYVTGGRTIWTIAGSGAACDDPPSDCGDGPSALDAALSGPAGLAVGPDGAVYIADTGDHKIRRLTTAGTLSTIAGTGEPCPVATAACGDGGPGALAQLNEPRGLALAGDGTLLVADSGGHRVRALGPDGVIRRVAGSGEPCGDPFTACGDGGPALSASLRNPSGVAIEPSGDILIADTGDRRVRRVRDGLITTLAGTGAPCTGGCGDGGPAGGAAFTAPAALALAAGGDLYVADAGAHRVRRIAAGNAQITTLAGDGAPCAGALLSCGDGGPPADGQVTAPLGVAVAGGAVLIADSGANRIRRAGSTMATVAGTGAPCALSPACGDGGAATLATLSAPSAIAVDDRGDVFVADSGANLVRWLTGPVAASPSTPPSESGERGTVAVPAEQQVAAVVNAPKPAVRRRSTIVRCVGLRCRVAGAGAALTARLRARARSATLGTRWARVELRRGGRRWASGAGPTLARALTLVPERPLRAGRYRLRITQSDRSGERRRDRIVRLR